MLANESTTLNKIEVLQQKIEAMSARLKFLQDSFRHMIKQSESINENPLEKYLFDQFDVDSIPSLKSKRMSESKKNHSRHHSQQIGQLQHGIKKFETQDRALDVKSFRMIKQSILLNSDEINHVKEKMIELQKTLIERFMGIEQGVGILARLTQTFQSKIKENFQKIEEIESIKNPKKPKTTHLQEQIRIDRVIKKYQNKSRQERSTIVKNIPNFYY